MLIYKIIFLIFWLIGGIFAYHKTIKYWYYKMRYLDIEFEIPFTLKDKLSIHMMALCFAICSWIGYVTIIFLTK